MSMNQFNQIFCDFSCSATCFKGGKVELIKYFIKDKTCHILGNDSCNEFVFTEMQGR